MRKFFVLFLVLLTTFAGIWTVKAQSPVNRPDSYGDGVDLHAGAWWAANSTAAPVSDADWILDPEIPANYLPVPGEDELYMVIDDDGNILGYRKRTRQEDGSWVWEDVNPDIPENYEAVEGLENVYRVTAADGTVSYFRYIRNEDDTFAFIPVDANGKPLDDEAPDGNTIPDNYRHVSGNVYAVLNEYGVVIGYKERRPNEDGTFTWVDCEKPVDKSGLNSTERYFNSNPDTALPSTGIETPTATSPGLYSGPAGSGGTVSIPGNEGAGGAIVQQPDGTYVQTETLISSETAGGWTTTYQTIVTRVYSMDGTLLSTNKDGPMAISKVQAGSSGGMAPDQASIAASLGEELARVSTGITYKGDLAQEVLSELNNERIAEGLSPLTMDTSSDAYKLAQVRAADMAIYDHSDFDSPTYGTLSDMMNRFGLRSALPSENTWKTTTSKTASAIHSRFMVLDGARQARMSSSYTNIGIAVVQKNGYYYVCEVLID